VIVLALPRGGVPVAEVDEIICAFTPEPFRSVGLWYEDFSETSDEEVCNLLREAADLQTGLSIEGMNGRYG
jgi:predicted phosphoribosyltransferase